MVSPVEARVVLGVLASVYLFGQGGGRMEKPGALVRCRVEEEWSWGRQRLRIQREVGLVVGREE